ncbi:Protein DENND6B [Acipenser ruthenus]|uniref:Protein DENND6B n=1 Tax=Acipenser ruthenus TaxID=7906 RepID=A0A444U5H9_ACIRT|nr:Protein DENND6B [Acipenser ruthenus]
MDLFESNEPRSYFKSERNSEVSARRLPWARFSSWLECVCVVTFDLELGQAIERDTAHYYGYVYFRQVKDVSVKRGYFQKSLVLISRLPFVNLFQSLLQLIAPEYFEKLEPCLEAVCNEIDQWPAPIPGQTLNLPVMGVVIQNLLPAPMILPTVHELDLFKCFQPILIHIQMLWELMLLGEPIVVMAPSPTVSSETILALTSSISPLKYCCDYHPYFTIHNSEFKEYTTRTQAPPNVVLGVTNPFFIKTFQYWPHIIRIGDLKMSGDLPKQVKVKKLTKLKTLDTKPGVYTAYKTFLHKDKTLSKRLLKERYLVSLMPLQRAVIPWKNPPQIRPFSQDEFMRTLEHSGPQLTSVLKGDWIGLYSRFFRSPNFDGWYRQRHKEMTQKLECLHLEIICEADLLAWIKDKSEVEIVDLVLKLREKLVKAHHQQLPVREEVLQKLELYIETIISSLPEDLQVVLHRH